jgi:serpin B
MLVACSGSTTHDGANPSSSVPGHSEARSALARDTTPALTDGEKQKASDAGYALTADLLGKLRTTPAAAGNFAFSPFSISLAMSMPYAGAKGATADEMAKTLHWSMPQDRVAKAFDWTTLELSKRADEGLASAQQKAAGNGDAAQAPSADSFRLHVVNAVWGDQRVSFESPFLDTMAVNYGAGVTLADFVKNFEAERLAINGWVSDETQTRIQNLLPAGALDETTRIVLVNALHLKMPWAEPLTAESAPSSFARADGSKVDATFVGAIRQLSYFEDANVQAVSVLSRRSRARSTVGRSRRSAPASPPRSSTSRCRSSGSTRRRSRSRRRWSHSG